MARAEWREKARVQAIGSDGRTYTVVATVLINHAETMDGRLVSTEGRGELRTSEGDEVFYLGKGHYKLGTTDIELRSDDPNAP